MNDDEVIGRFGLDSPLYLDFQTVISSRAVESVCPVISSADAQVTLNEDGLTYTQAVFDNFCDSNGGNLCDSTTNFIEELEKRIKNLEDKLEILEADLAFERIKNNSPK